MIECTNCKKGEIIIQKNKYICDQCKKNFSEKNNLVVFHAEKSEKHDGMSHHIYNDLAKGIKKHFWFKARRDYIYKIFKSFVGLKNNIIDIGSGVGDIPLFLISKGYENMFIGDVHLSGLKYTEKSAVKKRYQFDLIKTPFRNHFDIVTMFDVLEHIDDDEKAIKNIHKMLKKNGRAIIMVPAHLWLWNREDDIVSHRRRYEVKEIKRKFEKNGFRVMKVSAFFIAITPLLFLRRILDKFNKSEDKERFEINSIVNMILGTVCFLENRLLASRLFSKISFRVGGSIMLVAEKE